MIGPPNSGKSSILNELTNAKPDIADYPFTTRIPLPGMMPFENILIQLVDLPPISPEFTEGWLAGMLRITSAALFIVDMSNPNVLDEIEMVRKFMENHRIFLVKQKPEKVEDPRLAFVKTLMVGTKYDMPSAPDNFSTIKELYRQYFRVIPMSIHSLEMIEELKREIFDLLEIIRIYSKVPGKSPDKSKPFVVSAGSTVMDVAREIHQDFANTLRYARVWGSQKYDGQRVNRDYILADEDILELHI
ncbi:MAG: TGS domain-containing protein [Candidatus Eremiobacteraeota bacterium]|nr:TGS domain-containing protein [Candidatus Eremiobacteraeota bacterium]